MIANLEYCIDLILEELETLSDIEEESTIKLRLWFLKKQILFHLILEACALTIETFFHEQKK